MNPKKPTTGEQNPEKEEHRIAPRGLAIKREGNTTAKQTTELTDASIDVASGRNQ
jgi:hypothetical protein